MNKQWKVRRKNQETRPEPMHKMDEFSDLTDMPEKKILETLG